MNKDNLEHLREGTRRAYSTAAERPLDEHPFPVGTQFAESLGYPRELLLNLPPVSKEAFAGVLNVSIGVDFCNRMLLRARQAASEISANNVEFYQADGEYLPFERAKFDIALVNGIFNLNPKRDAIFSELARVIKEGGKLYAAELILKAPLPHEIQESEADWFA
jgi:SAM-dependent methyltransferase